MSTLILYYSRDGSTKLAAEYLGRKLACPVEALQEEKPSRNFLVSGFHAASGKRREVAGNPWASAATHDTLILGAPIWAGNGNPVMNAFLDRADLKGKQVWVFTLQAGPGRNHNSKALQHYRKLIEQKGGQVAGTWSIQGTSPGKTASVEHLQSQLDEWELLSQ